MSNLSNKIMVVDDDARNHRIMEGLLEDDYEISSVYSGEACLDALAKNRPDIILLDIMMPGLNGYEVCDSIIRNKATSDLPIIFVSAKDTLEERLKGYEVGAVDYFVKPFDHEELLAKIGKILEYKNEKDQLQQDIAIATNTAKQEATSSSELRVIIKFLNASYQAKSREELAYHIFEATKALGLNARLQFRTAHGDATFSDSGNISPLEESILRGARAKGDIFDFQDKAIFNNEMLSLLVKNMPVQDGARIEQTKQLVCTLLKGTESRLIVLDAESDMQRQKKQLIKLVEYVNAVMGDIGTDIYSIRIRGTSILEEMNEFLEDLTPTLSLSDQDETSIQTMTRSVSDKMTAVLEKGIVIDDNFMKIIRQLKALDPDDATYGERVEEILFRVSTRRQ